MNNMNYQQNETAERPAAKRGGFYSGYITDIPPVQELDFDDELFAEDGYDEFEADAEEPFDAGAESEFEPMPASEPEAEPKPEPEAASEPETETESGEVSYNLWLPQIVEGKFAPLVAAVVLVLIAMLVPSGRLGNSYVSEQRDFFGDISSTLNSSKRESVASIFELPPVYILPWGEQVNPAPSGEYSQYEENGITYLTYEDETISVKYWTEFLMRSQCHFAEVRIAHPTQLRSAYAGGEFDSSARYTPQDIANQINAVVAINADFCGYRNTGVIVRQNTLYRNKPNGWDVLLIDSNGDFHIMNDRDVESSGIMDEYEIVNSFEFGPSLVIDGEINIINPNSGCGETYNMHHSSPRTAIGQLGELTYLMCVVEGKSDTSWGLLTSQMAELMLEKGCVQAYNLDGGKSSTLIFQNEPMNAALWGGQRVVSDILYFATALPES